jgi:hypothetical protein
MEALQWRFEEPKVKAVQDARAQDPELAITVLLPELSPRLWWQESLHNQFALELVLRHEPGVAVTTVPVQRSRRRPQAA